MHRRLWLLSFDIPFCQIEVLTFDGQLIVTQASIVGVSYIKIGVVFVNVRFEPIDFLRV